MIHGGGQPRRPRPELTPRALARAGPALPHLGDGHPPVLLVECRPVGPRVARPAGVEHVLGEVEVHAGEPRGDLVDCGQLVDRDGGVPAVDVVAKGEEVGPEGVALRDGVVVELAEGLVGFFRLALCLCVFSGSIYQ